MARTKKDVIPMATEGDEAPEGNGFGAQKTPCPVTRGEFAEHAEPMSIQIGGQSITGNPRTFSSGSLGWYINGTARVVINGKECKVQVGGNIVLANSKELPK